jgi:hypothetical protein
MKKTKDILLLSVIIAMFIGIIMIDRQRKKDKQYYGHLINLYKHTLVRSMSLNDSLIGRLGNIHDLTWDNIDFWLGHFQVKCDTVVKAQIILETGNLTSDILMNGNNLFGMKLPKHRQTRAIREYKNHAGYSSYVHSIEDYKLWQVYFGFDTLKTSQDYINCLMRHGYAEANNYDVALYGIIEKLRENYKYFN